MKKARLVGVVMFTPEKSISVRAIDGKVMSKEMLSESLTAYGTATYYMRDDGVLIKHYNAECSMFKSGVDASEWEANFCHTYDIEAYDFFVRNRG